MRLNLGCGVWLRRGFVNVDLYAGNALYGGEGLFKQLQVEDGAEYVQADIRALPFRDGAASYVEMMDVVEHLSLPHLIGAMREVNRVMEPGAKLVIVTVNFDALALDWVRMAMGTELDERGYWELTQGIFGHQLSDSELHRCPINPRFLDALLCTAGFREGIMWLLPKGAPSIQVGTIEAEDGIVARYERLIAEATK